MDPQDQNAQPVPTNGSQSDPETPTDPSQDPDQADQVDQVDQDPDEPVEEEKVEENNCSCGPVCPPLCQCGCTCHSHGGSWIPFKDTFLAIRSNLLQVLNIC